MNTNRFADSCFCGSVTFCIVIVLLVVFGVPLFVAGIALTSMFGMDGASGPSVAGKTMLTIACLMAAAGLVAVFYMCRMGPTLLKTTPAPKKNKQPKKQTYQQFTNGDQDDSNPAPPAYEESSRHRQFYPSPPTNPQINYKPATQPQASHQPQPNYQCNYPQQGNYQGDYPQHGNYPGNYPQQGSFPQQAGYQHQMIPQQQQQGHSGSWMPPYSDHKETSSNVQRCPPESFGATAPPYGDVANYSSATPSAPPAYGAAPPSVNAGLLPMKI